MRALILVAGAALAVSACSSNDNANNTMNVDENVTTTDMNATDMNATDMNATDANMTMNAADTANAAADNANAAAANANAAANNAM
ncbi:MAG TPA: hypothetical protein VNB78_03490 [Sphingomicrobium sp.]|jgi:hypothetical protein|nr:hypothetical protein [Sphingomicrobium sp.]